MRLDQNYGQRRSCDLADESISAPRQSVDPDRILGRITERDAKFVHGRVQAVLEIHKRVCGPQLFVKFFPGHNSTRTLEQQYEDLKRLTLQPDLNTVPEQFPGFHVR